jgi:ABC-type polysaccharide/polyol phosphate export permease
MTDGGKSVKKSRYLMIFVALMELALVLFTLALYNIATAFILTAVIVPIVLCIGPRRTWQVLQIPWILLVPLTIDVQINKKIVELRGDTCAIR